MSQQGSGDRVAEATGRALVVLPHADRDRADGRPLAEFLAQLIACRRGLPAFRKARKAEPASARLAYARARPPAGPARLDVSF